MKCLKCGAELSEDTKFCSYCGAKVEAQTEIPPIPPEVEEADEPKTEEKYTYQNNTVYNAPVASKPASNADKIKTKFLSVWSKLKQIWKNCSNRYYGICYFRTCGFSCRQNFCGYSCCRTNCYRGSCNIDEKTDYQSS